MSNLSSGHLGNGLIVWRTGTDETIAHIDKHRRIKLRCFVSSEELAEIQHIAETDDRNVSVSQDEKVFVERPKT